MFIGNNLEEYISTYKLPLIEADVDETIDKQSKKKRQQQSNRSASDNLKLLYCFCGLLGSYLVWGLIQEKIMTRTYQISNGFLEANPHLPHNLIKFEPYGGGGNVTTEAVSGTHRIRFQNSQFLVFINRILGFLVATTILLVQERKNLRAYFFENPQPPFYQYLYSSLSNTLSAWCQYEALKFVSFPLQVLSKSCKMIPILLMSQLVRKVKHKRSEWLFAFAISLGMFIFLMNEHKQMSSGHHHHTTVDTSSSSWSALTSGIIILALYLLFDSFTSNWQNVLLDRYNMSHTHMMAATNLFSILLTSISLVQQNIFVTAFRVLGEVHELFRDALLLSVCSAIGQTFIFYTIKHFGAVTFTLIMTLRQVFAIILSCIAYSHPLSIFGFFGIFVVMASVFVQNIQKFYKISLC